MRSPHVAAVLVLAALAAIAGGDAAGNTTLETTANLATPRVAEVSLSGYEFEDVDVAEGVDQVRGGAASGGSVLDAHTTLSVARDGLSFGAPFGVGDGVADLDTRFTGTLSSVNRAFAGLVASVPTATGGGANGSEAVTLSFSDLHNTGEGEEGVVTHTVVLGLRAGTIPTALCVSPASAPASAPSSTPVVITVNNLGLEPHPNHPFMCCFGSRDSSTPWEDCAPVTVVSPADGTLTCDVPEPPTQPLSAYVAVQAPANWRTNALQFLFYTSVSGPALPAPGDTSGAAASGGTSAPTSTGVAPISGPVQGGTPVNVTVAHLDAANATDGLVCTFSFGTTTLTTPAKAAGDAVTVSCSTPPVTMHDFVGLATVGVAGRGAANSPADGVKFLFRKPRVVVTVQPNVAVPGAGTQLAVLGYDIAFSTDLECVLSRFVAGVPGAYPVVEDSLEPFAVAPATWISSTAASCVVPSTSATLPLDAVVTLGEAGAALSDNGGGVDGGALRLVAAIANENVETAAPVDTGTSTGPNGAAATAPLFSPGELSGSNQRGVELPSPTSTPAPTVLPPSTPAGDGECAAVDESATTSTDTPSTATPTLLTLSPRVGPTTGGTTLTLTVATALPPSPTCVFRSANGSLVVTDAARTTSTQVSCVSPPASSGMARVVVADGTSTLTAFGLQYLYHAPAAIHTLSPTHGSSVGGTRVVVEGTGFAASSTLACAFGGVPATALEWVSESTIVCVAPGHAPGAVSVVVTTNGQEETAGVGYEFVPQTVVKALTPTTGSASGGTRVQLTGAMFSPSVAYTCTWAPGVTRTATYVSSSELRCTAPPGTAGASASVDVHGDGALVPVDNTDGVLGFTFVKAVEVTGAEPLGGTTAGGTVVTISGAGFATGGDPQCHFGASVVDASVVSSKRLTCRAPASSGVVGPVVLQVTLNGVDFAASSLHYHYGPAPTVVSMSPTLGLETGGTRVLVFGADFVNSGLLSCVFGRQVAPATWISSQVVACEAPPFPPGRVNVEVTNNGFEFSGDAVNFLFTSTMVIRSVAPALVPASGGTPVLVRGSGFTDAMVTGCRFGEDAPTVVATVHNATALTCTTPATGLLGAATLALTNNRVDFVTSSVAVTYVSPLAATGILPKLGPTSGGTTLTISGSGFATVAAGGAPLLCVFGAATTVPAMPAADGNSVECTTPSVGAPGVATVGVTYNGVDVFGAGLQYLYHTPAAIHTLSPTHGSSVGGTRVVVEGTGFAASSTLACAFGGVPATALEWVSESTIVCVAPGHAPGAVSVVVTTNGQEEAPGAVFTFAVDVSPVSGELPPMDTAPATASPAPTADTTPNLMTVEDLEASIAPPLAASDCLFGALEDGACKYAAPSTAATASEVEVVATPTPVPTPVPTPTPFATPAYAFPDVGTSSLGLEYPAPTAQSAVPLTVDVPEAAARPAAAPTCSAVEVIDYEATFSVFEPAYEAPDAPTSDAPWLEVFGVPATPDASFSEPLTVITGDDLTQPVPDTPAPDVDAPWVGFTQPQAVVVTGLEAVGTPADALTSPTGDECAWSTASDNPLLVVLQCTDTPLYPTVVAAGAPEGFPNPGDDVPDAAATNYNFSFTFAEVVEEAVVAPAADAPAVADTVVYRVEALSPTYGRVFEAQVLTLTGSDFDPSVEAAVCEFNGTRLSPITYVSTTALTCAVPVAAVEGTIPFTVRVPPGVHPPWLITANASSYTFQGPFVAPEVVTTPEAPEVTGEEYAPPPSPVTLTDAQVLAAEEADMVAALAAVEEHFPPSPTPPEEDATPLGVPTRPTFDGVTGEVIAFESTITGVEPDWGPTLGGTLVVVTGTRLLPQDDLGRPTLSDLEPFCVFGGVEVPAAVLGGTSLTCVSPRVTAPTTTAFTVVFRQPYTEFVAPVSSPGLTFVYYTAPSVRLLHPPSGSAAGGTRVAVIGDGFVAGRTVVRFASADGPSVVVTPFLLAAAELVVIAPPHANVGFATVEVSNNGADFSSSGVTFYYDAPVTIDAVNPSSGSDLGGTDVWVTGGHFLPSPNLHCRFAQEALVPATYMSSTLVRCVSPAVSRTGSAPLPVTLEVTNNGVEFSTAGVTFTYNAAAEVHAVAPTWGPTTGGTLVTLTGTNFAAGSPLLHCQFGDAIPVPAVSSTSTAVTCRSPTFTTTTAHPIPVAVGVEVTNNGADYTTAGVTFEFRPFFDVQTISPVWGPPEGGTLVTVTGALILDSADLHCRFGDTAPVPATYVSPTALQCRAPTVVVPEEAPFALPLEISNDAVDYTQSGVLFRFGTVAGDPPAPGALPVDDAKQEDPTFDPLTGVATGTVFVTDAFGPDFLPNRHPLTFFYDDDVEVMGVSPMTAPLTGGTPVVMHGRGFDDGPGLQCVWGARAWTPATHLSNTTLTCDTPHGEAAGTIDLAVTTNGLDVSLTHVQFTFHPVVVVAVVDPVRGVASVATPVVVHGTGFLPTSLLRCGFGGVSTVATWEAPTRLRCASPTAAAAGVPPNTTVAVTVSNNAQDFSVSHTWFTFDAEAEVTGVDPVNGPPAGGTLVVVTGFGFAAAADHYCRFGDLPETRATFVNDTTVTCRTPAGVATPGAVPLAVKQFSFFDAASSMSVSAANFTFDAPLSIASFVPWSGPLTGGTVINVTGTGFEDRMAEGTLVCGFGTGEVLPATYVSSTLVQCVTPALDLSPFPESTHLSTRAFTLEISNNAQDFTAATTLFYYAPAPTATGLHPPSGPSNGGTTVTVSGSGFVNSSRLVCSFGDLPSFPAVFVDAGRVQCEAPPPAVAATTVAVRISNNDQQFTGGTSPIAFVHEDPVVTSLLADRGDVYGGVQVVVTGGPWLDLFPAGTHCAFGLQVVPGVVTSSTEVVCEAPALSGRAGEEGEDVQVAVEVTVNDQDYTTSDVLYTYQPETRVAKLYPDHGPAVGGTTVQVTGGAFSNITAQARCRFGAESVQATYASDGEVTCVTPHVSAAVPGADPLAPPVSVPVELTFNDQDYTFAGVMYRYQPVAAVASIHPNNGPEAGGTVVTLTGGVYTNHTEGIRVGLFFPGGESIVLPAVWHSPSQVMFTTPALPPAVDGGNYTSAAVEVTFNNQDYTSSGVLFEFQAEVRVFGVFPHHGPLGGGTRVLLSGQHFRNHMEVFCLFGDDRAHAAVPVLYFHNTTHVECVVPPGLAPGPVNVTVSNNGNTAASNFSAASHGVVGNVAFTYDDQVVITDVFPPLGPESGNVSLRVMGSGFLPTLELACRFGDVIVQGVWVGFDTLYCVTPAHPPGRVALELTANGQDFTHTNTAFMYVPDTAVDAIIPVSGPAVAAGTVVTVYGANFVNTSLLSCRFANETVPATYVSPSELQCAAPPHVSEVGGHLRNFLTYQSLQWHLNDRLNPITGSRALFPAAHHRPFFSSFLVDVDVSVNGQDYTTSGVRFLYQQDAEVGRVFPPSTPAGGRTGRDTGTTTLWVFGANFVNATTLRCRIGNGVVNATFMSPSLVLCATPTQPVGEVDHGQWAHGRLRADGPAYTFADVSTVRQVPGSLFVEVTNNGVDYTHNRVVFDHLPPCPSGHYCPLFTDSDLYVCPRGTYCPGVGNTNFTLCPRGMYQPSPGQSDCLRCPVGYICPEEGLPVPRICPAGFVCDVTGAEFAEQPCPEGHFCLEGTATVATTCGNPHAPSNKIYPRLSLAERQTTVRAGIPAKGNDLVLGARNTACWSNGTTDFGLHHSANLPARYWQEAHTLPLAADAPFAPRRGRYCLDDACVRLADADSLPTSDPHFDYAGPGFALRRPVPCPPGMYCHAGTAVDASNQRNYTTPQPCFESMYCPEGSETPRGVGACPAGFYCPFGSRLPCPVGTSCPNEGAWDPWPCAPGTFNGQVGQKACTECPPGYICPGFGRVDPAICPPGFVCTLGGQATPDSICPAGFYCNNGTLTSDPFRNDTTLRPYPCHPGTYCTKGVGFDQVVELDPLHAQFCTEGFYCEAASASPIGNGLCPRGFFCPRGTAVPVPTAPGTFSELEGTVAAADCLPGFYAPTIETVTCYPCPPGTQCENDGTSEATVCSPGTYRSLVEVDGVVCVGCPQGTWSKNWELRDVNECTRCPSGTFCPIDGMTDPCSFDDFPTPYEPTNQNQSIAECNNLGPTFYYGILQAPIDVRGRGPNILVVEEENPLAECYSNVQPFGSIVYNRFKEAFGPQYELQRGYRHQGYSALGATYPGVFAQGSRVIDLPVTLLFEPGNNCTSGHFAWNATLNPPRDQWYPGNCEADVFCQTEVRTQAEPCSEGFVCGQRTTSLTAQETPCQGGYVCDFGTTPDVDLLAPNGKYARLCPAGFICSDSTGVSQETRSPCPIGYFCPTGTHDALLGRLAGDAFFRNFTRDQADPFLFADNPPMLSPPHVRLPRPVSIHDEHCFLAANETRQNQFVTLTDDKNRTFSASVSVLSDKLCARDHKWRIMQDAVERQECFCREQVILVQQVFRLWKCTAAPARQCAFNATDVLPAWSRDHEVLNGIDQVSVPVEFPAGSSELELRYLIDCARNEVPTPDTCDSPSRVITNNEFRQCPSFCSWVDLKAWVEDKWLSETERTESEKLLGGTARIRPLLYDLKYAVDLLDTSRLLDSAGEPVGTDDEPVALGDDLMEYLRLTDAGEPYRMDMCDCEQALRCPNGTSTDVIGASSVEDCVRTGVEVLQRVSPIPDDHPAINATGDNTLLSDLYQRESRSARLGILSLGALESAAVTMNLTSLSTNFTYGDHYQVSVYADCLPCPPRYVCDRLSVEPQCSSPTVAEQASFGVLCADCCTCERHSMPQWFQEEVENFPYFDNKHVPITFTLTALKDVSLLVTLELVHARYVNEFARDLAAELIETEMWVHTPHRARTTPRTPELRYSFLAIIEQSNFDELALPFNLPQREVREPGTTSSLLFEFEDLVFIDRPADILLAHNTYDAQKLERALASGSVLKASGSVPKASGSVPDAAAAAVDAAVEALVGARRLQVADDDGAVEEVFVSREPHCQDCEVTRDPSELVQKDTTWWAQADDNVEIFELGLNYLPFFSNCAGYDSHVFIAKLTEDNYLCRLEPLTTTINVDQYPWNAQFQPLADECLLQGWVPTADDDNEGLGVPGVPLACVYEEDIFNPPPVTRWFELEAGEALFSLTKEPVPVTDFVADDTAETRWGRSATITGLAGTEQVVDVGVLEGGEESLVPQLITMSVSFYQITQARKRIVGAEASFRNFCTISESEETQALLAARTPPVVPCIVGDYRYSLEFSMMPLEWLELLNLFEFTADVYVMLFVIIGLITVMFGATVWVFHRMLSRQRPPPHFRFTKLWAIVTPAPTSGVILSTAPVFMLLFVVFFWFITLGSSDPVLSPSSINFESWTGDWLDRQVLNEDRITTYKLGRIGTAMLGLGFFAMLLGAKLFIPNDSSGALDDDDAMNTEAEATVELGADDDGGEEVAKVRSSLWRPLLWKRSHMIFCAFIEIGILMVILEFSYSEHFENNQYLFIVILKILQMFFDLILAAFLRDNLLVSPLLVTIEVTEILITMGAEDFTDFVLAFFVETVITILERIYLDPLLKSTASRIPKWKMSCKRRCRKSRRLTREQRLKEEIEWRRVTDEIQLESEGVEPLLDSFFVYSNETLALFLTPFVQLLLLAMDASSFHELQITRIPDNYGIRPTDLIYYTIFSVVIIPAQLGMDMFLLNTQELAHGWKLFDYISYQRYRFTVRETRWQMSCTTLDESISPAMQYLDMMCFSAQYYFMSALFAWGMIFIQLGITIHLRAEYNMFGDKAFLFIIFICYFMVQIVRWICLRFANTIGLWRRRAHEGTVDDEVAAKLAIGEGKQEDLEAERMELRALNSERFRHKFLERSRPWVLQHLTELLTPRTLQMPGADGRPNIEYIRDVYNDLENMAAGMRHHDDRSDITSDTGNDDYLEMLRREWAKKPLSLTSAAIAKMWLAKARKRKTYATLVVAITESNKKQECANCERTVATGATMQVDLAKDGKPYPNLLDEIIQGFEAEQGEAAFDPVLWKAYFRKHAVFITRCNVCTDLVAQAQKAAAARREAGPRGPVRAVDVSSDDDDLGPSFKPMVVSRKSSEAKVLSKWLTAARRRLGGVFPRPHAKDEMEAHARQQREARAERTRRALKREERKQRAEMTGEWNVERDGPRFGKWRGNAATKALARLWLNTSKRSLVQKSRAKTDKLRDEVAVTLEALRPEDDWYYGKATREKGAELLRAGEKLLVERSSLVSEEEAQTKSLEEGQRKFEAAKEAERMGLVEAMEKEMEAFREQTKADTDRRVGELTATRRDRELECAQIEASAAPADRQALHELHAEQLEGLTLNIQAVKDRRQKTITQHQSELQLNLRDQESLLQAAVADRRDAVNRKLRALKTEVSHKIKVMEEKWVLSSHEWVAATKRKVRSKEREDQLDAKSPEG